DNNPPRGDHMPNSIMTGGITRRGLLQGAATGSLVIGSGLGPAFAEEPRRGGTMRAALGQGSTSDSFDPAAWQNNYMIAFGFTLYNRLTEVDSDGKIIPELAENWEATPDATIWTFKIRRADFHDGTPVRVS